jgi:glycosyltransferase involved in cell wall biosynthesis
MNLLILPEYEVTMPHVVVDSVYAALLPGLGHTVHMLRPIAGATGVVTSARPGLSGKLVGFPPDRPGSKLGFVARIRRKMRVVEEGLRQFERDPIDAVLVRNDLAAAQQASRFARRRRVPFVFQVSSPEAEFRINGRNDRLELRRVDDILRGYLDLAWRRRLCRRADVVLAISTAMRRHLIETDRVPEAAVFSFPMGAGSQPDPTPAQIEAARAQLALPWKRTIVYSGVIDPIREPTFMLDVLDLVRKDVPDSGLLVMTYQEDERRRAFEAEAVTRRLPVKVVGPIHHSSMSAYLKCTDVMLCSVPPRLEFAMMSPTKSLEALGAGVPVVGSAEVEEHQKMLGEVGAGIAVPFHADAFARALVSLLTDDDERRRKGEAGRRWAMKYRSYPRLARYLESILAAAVEGRPLRDLAHDPDDLAPDQLAASPGRPAPPVAQYSRGLA